MRRGSSIVDLRFEKEGSTVVTNRPGMYGYIPQQQQQQQNQNCFDPNNVPCHFPPMGAQLQNQIQNVANPCCMDTMQASFRFGSPLSTNPYIGSNNGENFSPEIPPCSVFTIPGSAKVCKKNSILVECLKPPTATGLFKIAFILDVTTKQKLPDIVYEESMYNAKVHKPMMAVLANQRMNDPSFARFYDRLCYSPSSSASSGSTVFEGWISARSKEFNKHLYCSDKKLQSLLSIRTKSSTSNGVGGLSQYRPENRMNEWMTLFKAGGCSSLNPMNEVTGLDIEHHKKFENLTFHGFLPSKDFQFNEEAFTSSEDSGAFNMLFSAELGEQGCVGIYSKLIEKSNRFDFLFKKRKSAPFDVGKGKTENEYKTTYRTFSTLKRKYYVICKTDAGHAATEAYKRLVNNSFDPRDAPCLEDFANSSHYRLYLKQCKENVRRLSYQFAASIGISIDRIFDDSECREMCPPSGYYNQPEFRRTFYDIDNQFDTILAKCIQNDNNHPGNCVNTIHLKHRECGQEQYSKDDRSNSFSPEVCVSTYSNPTKVRQSSKKLGSAKSTLEALLRNCDEDSSYDIAIDVVCEDGSATQISNSEEKGSCCSPNSPIVLIELGNNNNEEFVPSDVCDEKTTGCDEQVNPMFTPKEDWRTFRTELHPNVGKPVSGKEKYMHFDNILHKVMAPFYANKESLSKLSYVNWYKITLGVRSTKSPDFSGNSLMRINSLQGYTWIKSTREGLSLMRSPIQHVFPVKSLPINVNSVITKAEKWVQEEMISNGCYLPTCLGFEGRKRYWEHLSTTERLNYIRNPLNFGIGSKYNPLFCLNNCDGGVSATGDDCKEKFVGGKLTTRTTSKMGVDSRGKLSSSISSSTSNESDFPFRSSSVSSEGDEGDETDSLVSNFSSEEEEDIGDYAISNIGGKNHSSPSVTSGSEILYENANSTRLKMFGLDKKNHGLTLIGKRGQSIIRPPEDNINIGSHCTMYCRGGRDGIFCCEKCGLGRNECNCYCGEFCPKHPNNLECGNEKTHLFASSHMVEGVELTSEQQGRIYLEFITNNTFTPHDATQFRKDCCKLGRDFCCMCGSRNCSQHPISEFCQRYPTVNPECLTQVETTVINVQETMEAIHTNICEQVKCVSSDQRRHIPNGLFSWQQLTPICIVVSDSSYKLPKQQNY